MRPRAIRPAARRSRERLSSAVRRRRRHVALAALALGLALAPVAPAWWLAAALGAGGAVAVVGRGAVLGATLSLLILAGALVGDARLAAIGVDGRAAPHGWLKARATTLAPPRSSAFGTSAPVELRDGPWAGARLLARASGEVRFPDLVPGAEVIVEGTAAQPRPAAEGDLDFAAQLRRDGLLAELELRSLAATGARRGGIAGVIDSMRARAGTAIDAGLATREAAVLRGMVLGEDERIPALVRDDFRRSGLAHLLAVSGQNVMLLMLLALPALLLVGAGPRTRIGVLAGLIALYVPLAGAAPSLQRAAVMGIAGLAALAAGRVASRWYALLLAAVATLAVNPLACGDVGWQLSFAALAGILLLARPLAAGMSALPRPLAEATAVTIAATLATAPLLAVHFEQVSLVALPANLLALPAVAPAMWLGMLDIAVGQIGFLGPRFSAAAEGVATAIGWLAAVPVGYLAALARAAAELPWAQVEIGLPAPLTLLAGYAAAAAIGVGLVRAGRGVGWAELGSRWRTAAPRDRLAAAALSLSLAAACSALLVAPPPPPAELTVRFLDVGQGDATLVQGPRGEAILFDGGRAEARVANLLRAAGVRRLDAVVATHVSADHHGGLAEVLQRYPVGLLIENGDGTSDRTFLALLGEARRRGVRIVPARAGQVIRAGAIAVRLLAPGPRARGPAPEDPNPRGVVAVVSSGAFDLFLSADAESPSLLPLELPDVEAIKVPHHGSSDPGLAEVLGRLRPQLAAIEVGENDYGHPHPATLDALRAVRAAVYRTDLSGTITLTAADGRMSVETER